MSTFLLYSRFVWSCMRPTAVAVIAAALCCTPPPVPPPEVEVSGCETLLAGPVCEMPEGGTLRLWAKSHTREPLFLALDGHAVSSAPREVQEGQSWEVSIPKGTAQLTLSVRGGDTEPEFVLPMRPAVPIPEIVEAEALRDEGKTAEAQRLLERLASDPEVRVQSAAMRALARIHIAQAQIDAAIDNYRRAADLDRNMGRLSNALRNELALAHTYLYEGRRFADARQALERAAQLVRVLPVESGRLAFYKGILEYETGDLRAALRELRIVREGSERIRSANYAACALPKEALLLQMLGREAEGEVRFQEAAQAAENAKDPCILAGLWSNWGWFRIQSRHRRAGAAEALHKARSIYQGSCRHPSNLAHVLTNLALAALKDGTVAEAKEQLAKAKEQLAEATKQSAEGKQHKVDALIRVAWLDIEGQIALREGRAAEALRTYDTSADLATVGLLPVERWQAEIGRARALQALGRTREAGEAYELAEELLWGKSLLVPADEGRAGFLGYFDESARAAVAFFLGHDPARAATIARRARARALATFRWIDRVSTLDPQERADWDQAVTRYLQGRQELEASAGEYWELSLTELATEKKRREAKNAELLAQLDQAIAQLSDEAPHAPLALSPPLENELILVYHPVENGWVGFAITSDGTTAKELGEVNPDAPHDDLSRSLLAPFHDALMSARRVRVLASGPLGQVDFHRLPWPSQGSALIETLPVTFGVDVGVRLDAAHRARSDGAPRALIVGDSQGDLPEAQREARLIADKLREAGWNVTRLLGEEATYRAVREALEQEPLDLLHWAGHARFAGREGWGSGLPLAEQSALAVSDVLALPRAPSLVVLSACDGAQAHGAGAVEGLGLAHAFISAGANAVLASTRPVRDTFAASLVTSFYGADAGNTRAPSAGLYPAIDVAERLQRAVRAEIASDSGRDWASFRVLVP